MGCYSCMKFLFIFLNVIFLLFGIAGVGVIVWILLDPSVPLHFTQQQNDFMIATVIYLIVALLLVLLSVLGIYSVSKEIRWALVVSFSLLLIVIVVEVASGVWIYINRQNLDEFTHAHVKRTVQEIYDTDKNIREMFDTIQSKMYCCGADNPADWVRNKEINMGITTKLTKFNIPTSCCRENIAESTCLAATQNIKIGNDLDFGVIYEKGCYVLIKENILNSLTVIFCVFGAILGVKVFGLFIGLILAFSMNRNNRYKA
ncbi:CD151 antigen-like [Sitophilus oryzae]|uniref:Tetraspanin n=1 Tax=Sitophilus oryzae TaxID=7048 RepID=A0A6J2Y5J8_SITOR|nr:CD151 antigen-like [Sitophilus oryzae]